MITRFRLEAEGNSKHRVIEELLDRSSKVIGLVTPDASVHDWECTDDVISKTKTNQGYRGRMVFVYRGG